MELKNYIACKDILGIQTNSEHIGWSFGHPTESVSDEEINKCTVVVRLVADPLEAESEKSKNLEKYHYWLGQPNVDSLFYERSFVASSRLRLMASDLRGERPQITANAKFLRYIRFRFNNLHSPGYHLTDLTSALLLQRDLCPLHCSGFAIDGATVAVIAPPDTGKTLTTMRAIKDPKASYISEDLAITDGIHFFSCPWTSTFRYYDELSMSRVLRWRMKLIKIFPPAELVPVGGGYRKIDSYIEKDRIAHNNKITHVVILARREGGIKVLDKDTARRMVFNLNRYEFAYMKNPMLTAYSYFNPEFNIAAMVEKEREILSKMIENSACWLVQSVDPTKFSELIINKVRGGG